MPQEFQTLSYSEEFLVQVHQEIWSLVWWIKMMQSTSCLSTSDLVAIIIFSSLNFNLLFLFKHKWFLLLSGNLFSLSSWTVVLTLCFFFSLPYFIISTRDLRRVHLSEPSCHMITAITHSYQICLRERVKK